MYRASSKRKELLRRIAVYSLMTFAVVGLVTLLVFMTLGYRYNQDEGLVQTGLVQFGSQPSGAQVTIDGRDFGARTPSKASLEAGSHAITMQRDGYRQWQKTVDVMGGAVLWLNYARLFPTEMKPANVVSFATVSSTAVSPDAKWMLIAEDPASSTLQLVDLGQDNAIKPAQLSLPSTLYTSPQEGESQRFELTKWDASSRYVLVKHSYGNQHEWLVVDTRDVGASQNITKLLDINASELIFSVNSASILYARIDNTVRRIDRGSATISKPLVENMAEFSLYGENIILFTRQPHAETGKREVGYYRGDDKKTYILGSYADYQGTPADIAISQYFGDTYVALSHDDRVDIFTGDLAHPDELKRVVGTKIAGGAQHLSIVTAGRFVIAQNAATYVVYDLELKKSTTTKLQGSGDVTAELRWLDGYNIWSDRGGVLRIYEFDGANQQEVMKVTPGFNVTLGPGERYLYGITQSNGKSHLTRVKMIL
jgi:hypothetical protein